MNFMKGDGKTLLYDITDKEVENLIEKIRIEYKNKSSEMSNRKFNIKVLKTVLSLLENEAVLDIDMDKYIITVTPNRGFGSFDIKLTDLTAKV